MSEATGAEAVPQVDTPKQTLRTGPTIEQIRQRGYEIYVSRATAPADELQDWLQAE